VVLGKGLSVGKAPPDIIYLGTLPPKMQFVRSRILRNLSPLYSPSKALLRARCSCQLARYSCLLTLTPISAVPAATSLLDILHRRRVPDVLPS
jgi:hypothetical protein